MLTAAQKAVILLTRPFRVTDLFRNGEQGWAYWYDDPALYPGGNHQYLFQDSAGTTPVTAVGQPLGMVKDRSGRGNHRIQATSAARPILRQDSNGNFYAEFDGTDDSHATSSTVDASAYDKVTMVVGVTKASDAALGCFAEFNSGNPQSFSLFAPVSAADNFFWRSVGSNLAFGDVTVTGYSAPTTKVITGHGDISGDYSSLRINGGLVGSSVADQGSLTYGTASGYFGAREGTSFYFNGREYSNVARFGPMGENDRNRLEKWTAQRMGVRL